MRINLTRSLSALTLVALMVTAGTTALRAQDDTSSSTSQTNGGATLQDDSGTVRLTRPDFQVAVDPVETAEPYVHWHTHTGSAPECVASLRLQSSSAVGGYDYVSALVVRCDGFVLVPRTALDKMRAGARADLVVTGAEGENVVAPIPIAGWSRAILEAHRIDYALLKVNGHHIRCLHLLAGGNTRQSDAVKIVYSVPNVTATGSVCTAVTLQAKVGQTEDHGGHFTLEAVEDANATSVAGNDIPIGAAVVDAETGAALGLVTSNSTPLSFSTFLRFNEVFNEIGLAPDRDAIKLLVGSRLATSISATNSGPTRLDGVEGVCHVPGGPFTLQGTLRDYYVKTYNTDVVCTPDFQIDEVPVTNGDYRAWMQLPKVHAGKPDGWSVEEATTPVQRTDFPVTGVDLRDAMAYLGDREMRLPTEVEWQRAAKVTSLVWLDVLWKRWNELASLADAWSSDFMHYWSGLLMQDQFAESKVTGDGTPPPVFATGESPSELEIALKDKAIALTGVIGGEFLNNSLGRFLHPVRQYFADFSVFGMVDATLNAPELTLPRGDYETFGYKPHADGINPYISWTKYYHRGGTVFDRPNAREGPVEDDLLYYQIEQTDVPAYYMLTTLGLQTSGKYWASVQGGKAGDPTQKVAPPARNRNRGEGEPKQFISRYMSFEWLGFTYPEFRGAR